MANEKGVSVRQKKVDRFLRAGDAGTVAFLTLVATGIASYRPMMNEIVFTPGWITNIAIVCMPVIFVSFGYMFFRRNTDEYTHAIFVSAVTFAFFVVVFWALVGPIPETFYEQHLSAMSGEPVEDLNIVAGTTGEIAILAYFIGFHFKRLRGAF